MLQIIQSIQFLRNMITERAYFINVFVLVGPVISINPKIIKKKNLNLVTINAVIFAGIKSYTVNKYY